MKKIFTLLCLCPVFVFSQDKVVDQLQDYVEFKKIEFNKIEKNQVKEFRVSEDKFKNSVYLHHKKETDNNTLITYIGIVDGEAFLRLRTNYSGSRWVFYDRVILNIDGKNYTHIISDLKREAHAGGNVTERADMPVDKESYKILSAISNSEGEISMRFKGQKVKDIKLSQKAIQSIKETLKLFNSF